MNPSASSSACPTADLLRQFVEDRLSVHQAAAVERHLEHCNSCNRAVDQLEREGVGRLDLRQHLTQATVLSSQDSLIDLLADPERVEQLPLPELSLPERIDKYEILEILGSGGMGVVLKARHAHLKREVAIKLVKGTRRFDAHAIARFSQEIEAIGQLDHANIVRASDAGVTDDGQPYLVMELLQGRDVETIIKRRGPLSPDDASKLIRQTAAALAHVHQAGLVHRDIKPSNLFVTKTGIVKLLDLGLARLYANADQEPLDNAVTNSGTQDSMAGPLTSRLSVVGSPSFVAPEQIEQSNTVTNRADIYSLGCTFHYLLTGRVPYRGSQAEVLAAHLGGQFPSVNEFRSDVPPPLEKLIRWMASRNPDHRIGSAREIVGVLDKLQASARAKPSVVPPPLPPIVQKKPWRIWRFW